MKRIAVILASSIYLVLAGCALAPGMRFNPDPATDTSAQTTESVDVNGQRYVLLPLTVAGANAVATTRS